MTDEKRMCELFKAFEEVKHKAEKEERHRLQKELYSPELLEQLADLEHQQWAHWTQYLLGRLTLRPNYVKVDKKTQKDFKRWAKQIITPYRNLSKKEKESDREWARKVLERINKVFGGETK